MDGGTLERVIDGRYRLGALLGRGGMADVYAAYDLRLRRDVAAKVLRADWAREPEMRRRFDGEARTAAALSHPNVVAVYDTGEHDGLPYIVMERLPGGSVADELRSGPVPAQRALVIAHEVLSALDAAHGRGIVHRDIKPANLLLTADGHVKVADFGIAKLTEGRDQTVTAAVLGTPAYLAPERLAGAPATPASDLYSVGALLYRALSGRDVFEGETPLAVLNAISAGSRPRLHDLCPDLDPRLATTVERAMAPAPEDRPRSAATLDAALRSAPPRASGADVTVKLSPATARLPAAQRAPVPVRVSTAPATAAAPVPARTAPAPRRPLVLAAVGAALIVIVLAVAGVLWATRDDSAGSPPSSTTTATQPGPTIAPPLAEAIDELDRVVEP